MQPAAIAGGQCESELGRRESALIVTNLGMYRRVVALREQGATFLNTFLALGMYGDQTISVGEDAFKIVGVVDQKITGACTHEDLDAAGR